MKNMDSLKCITNYFDYYSEKIRPAICKIDISLKCNTRLNNKVVAELLNIDEWEVAKIRDNLNIVKLNKGAFIKIMAHGSSEICGLFKREQEIGSPYTYSRENLAYVYNLNIDILNEICDDLRVKEITWQTMPLIFSRTPFELKQVI